MKNYRVKKPVNLRNNIASQWADFYEDGYYYADNLEYIPIGKIEFDNWNPSRYQFYIDAFAKGRPADPIRADDRGSHFVIGDGNHRVAASVYYGYTHVPAIVSRKIEHAPPGKPPKDLYEEVHGRELLWFLQVVRAALRDYHRLHIEWGGANPDGYWFRVSEARPGRRAEYEMPCKVVIKGDEREISMNWDGRKFMYRGKRKGIERAFIGFIKKNVEKERREARIAENVILAVRTIRLDKARIKRLASLMAKRVWNDVKKRVKGEPIGHYVINERITITNVIGEKIPVVIVLKSNPAPVSAGIVTGGGAGKAKGKDAILIQINADLPPNIFNTGRFTQDLESMLLHELNHIADKFKKTREVTRKTVPTEDELDPEEYYNDPAEVRSYMQEVVYDVRKNFSKFYKKFGQKDAMKYALKVSAVWKQIEPHLNRRNKNKILSAVWNEVQDLMEIEA